jgi:DNA polymerase (family 10)
MNNNQIATAFEQIADLLEFQGANSFRVRAYRNASRVIGDSTESLEKLVEEEDEPLKALQTIEGIGKDLAEKIETLVRTGALPMLEELQSQVPASVLALLRVPGLGPKKAAALFKELHVESLADLRAACDAHRVRELKGFGAKTEETILRGLALAETATERLYWATADQHVQAIRAHLRGVPGLAKLEPAGSYRRGRDTIGDLDFLAAAADPNATMSRLAEYPEVEEVIARGETKMSVRLKDGLQVDLRVVPEDSFGAALQYFTGSKDHNVILRGMAKDRGLKVNEWGVFRGEEKIAGASEADVYATLDLPCFPPEMREARQEFEWAKQGKLPRLIELTDIVGDLHMHTTATDGTASIEEMISAAQARGLQYIAITDHSKRVTMANGLDSQRLCEHWDRIDAAAKKVKGFTVLKGVEVDILEAGGLDLDDGVLAEADWVVASVHYGQNQPREKITSRIVDALANPNVDAIAHPTGRLINKRKPYEVDLDAVYETAARFGKFLELNANPQRLDLDDVACAAAKRHGIPIVISTDAHSIVGLDCMRYGILQARRAGLTKEDVINTRPWRDVKKLIENRKL